jgi:hypothetical protein
VSGVAESPGFPRFSTEFAIGANSQGFGLGKQAGSPQTTSGEAVMNTHLIAYIPARTHNRRQLLAISAVVYLTLAIGLGVHIAFYLVIVSALIALWAVAARRYPAVGFLATVFFSSFLTGLIGGLVGYGGGYYGRRYRRW